MKVKIDTKEKFHVITLEEAKMPANMTEGLENTLLPYTQKEIKNVVLKLGEVIFIDENAAQKLVQIQQAFYDNNSSFVICELQPEVEKLLDEMEILEILNVTPTESEAWDIIQMEEIERELF